MPADLAIDRSAKLLIDRHGQDATSRADQRADVPRDSPLPHHRVN